MPTEFSRCLGFELLTPNSLREEIESYYRFSDHCVFL